MAKPKTSNNAVRDQLIADAKAKLAAADDAASAAKTAFDGASNAEDKATAQTALNTATADYQRYRAELEALYGGDEGDDGEEIDAIARTDIKHDGVAYEPGETITASRKVIKALRDAGAVAVA